MVNIWYQLDVIIVCDLLAEPLTSQASYLLLPLQSQSHTKRVNLKFHAILCLCFLSFTVIHLQFEQPTYTFSEDTQTSDAIIKIVISNYDKLVIEHDISVTVVGFPRASNATNDGMINDTMVSMHMGTCIHMYAHAGCLSG